LTVLAKIYACHIVEIYNTEEAMAKNRCGDYYQTEFLKQLKNKRLKSVFENRSYAGILLRTADFR